LKENTKIAVIGLGGVAQLVHLPILSKINSVDIVAVSEINKTRLNTVASKFNIKEKFTNLSEMIEKVDFDAAIISTPIHFDLTDYELYEDLKGWNLSSIL